MSREILLSCNPKKVANVPFPNEKQLARLDHVIDGDTVVVIICVGGAPLKLSIRINGIDAPESSVKSASAKFKKVNGELCAADRKLMELEVKAGQHVGEMVKELFRLEEEANQLFEIILNKVDKYGGRYVGDVWIPSKQIYLSEFLLNEKCVKGYIGDKKKPWTKDELRCILSK